MTVPVLSINDFETTMPGYARHMVKCFMIGFLIPASLTFSYPFLAVFFLIVLIAYYIFVFNKAVDKHEDGINAAYSTYLKTLPLGTLIKAHNSPELGDNSRRVIFAHLDKYHQGWSFRKAVQSGEQ